MGADPKKNKNTGTPIPIKGYVIPLGSEPVEIDNDVKCGLGCCLDSQEETRLVFAWI